MDYQDSIKAHYKASWINEPNIYYLDKGPAHELPYNFRILEFQPNSITDMWIYATCCMSQEEDISGIELHLFSSKQDNTIIELLTATAHYHRTGKHLDLGHTINFGRPWQAYSSCNYGFISLPYIDGPKLENMIYHNKTTKCYWLIPITHAEMEYKKAYGIEALEQKFEEKSFNYLDANRLSVV